MHAKNMVLYVVSMYRGKSQGQTVAAGRADYVVDRITTVLEREGAFKPPSTLTKDEAAERFDEHSSFLYEAARAEFMGKRVIVNQLVKSLWTHVRQVRLSMV